MREEIQTLNLIPQAILKSKTFRLSFLEKLERKTYSCLARVRYQLISTKVQAQTSTVLEQYVQHIWVKAYYTGLGLYSDFHETSIYLICVEIERISPVDKIPERYLGRRRQN
jgi:hypothetical protein